MEQLFAFQPTLNTLLLASVAPLVFLFFERRFWWSPQRLQQASVFWAIVAVLFGVVVLLKFLKGHPELILEEKQLLLMHLIPVLLLLLLVRRRALPVLGPGRQIKRPEPKGQAGADPFGRDLLNGPVALLSANPLASNEPLREELLSLVALKQPDAAARRRLFELSLSGFKMVEELNLPHLVELTAGQSGEVLWAICNQTVLKAFRRECEGGQRELVVSIADLAWATDQVVDLRSLKQ